MLVILFHDLPKRQEVIHISHIPCISPLFTRHQKKSVWPSALLSLAHYQKLSTIMINTPAAPDDVLAGPRASWSSLPPETQLQVLKFTDLVVPTRHVMWSTSDCFYLDHDAKEAAASIAWRIPLPLLLVNRAFHQQARDTFWRHNTVTVRPDTSFVWEKPDTPLEESKAPTRYATSQLLTDRLSPNTISSLRFLNLRLLDTVRRDLAETAREDWFESVDYAVKHGLSLSMLHVDCGSNEELCEGGFDERAPRDEDKVRFVRERVRERVWPYFSDEGIPRAISKQLFVQFPTEGLDTFYDIRKQTQSTLLDYEYKLEGDEKRQKWGTPRGTRRITVPAKDGKGEEDWIETVWVFKVKDPSE